MKRQRGQRAHHKPVPVPVPVTSSSASSSGQNIDLDGAGGGIQIPAPVEFRSVRDYIVPKLGGRKKGAVDEVDSNGRDKAAAPSSPGAGVMETSRAGLALSTSKQVRDSDKRVL